MNDPAPLPLWALLLIVIGFPVFFISLWCFICKLLSFIGGWHRLTVMYPAGHEKPLIEHRMQAGKVGLARYKGCLNVGLLPEGLHLSVMWLFRLGHPPLLIPWSELRNFRSHRFLGHETISCDIGSPKITSLLLPWDLLADSPVNPKT